MSLRGLFSPPREPSVAGMLLLSGLGGLAVARPPAWGLAAGAAVLLLHLFTFDPAFNSLRARRLGRFAVLASLNAAPYVASLALGVGNAAAVAAALSVLLVHTVVFGLRGPRDPLVYILGAAVPVLPALAIPGLLGVVTRPQLVFWLLLTGHAVATAAYIETRLPWRRLSPWAPVVLWAPVAAAAAALAPETLVALVEPSVKLARNVASKSRFIDPRPEELKRLGWSEMKRLLLFTSLLVAALLAAELGG